MDLGKESGLRLGRALAAQGRQRPPNIVPSYHLLTLMQQDLNRFPEPSL